MKRPKDLFASCDGKNYVRLDYSGISFLVACIDGLELSKFEDTDKLFIDIDTVIEWHQTEYQKSNGKSGSRVIAADLKDLKEKWAAKDASKEVAT